MRQQIIRHVADYLQQQFPGATIQSREDALTRNQVLTIVQGAETRHVELTERWLDDARESAVVSKAIEAADLGPAVRALPPNGILRVTPTGIERVAE